MVKYQQKEWIPNLNDSEKKSINNFTKGDYKFIRPYQAGDITKLDKFSPEIRSRVAKETVNFQDGLNKDGLYDGTVYRGMNFSDKASLNKFLKSKTIEMESDSSSSISKETAAGFASQGRESLLLEIKSKTAVSVENLSSFRSERELILRKGSKYAVGKKTTKNGLTTVQLVEL